MFTTRQLLAIALCMVVAMALLPGKPEGDASVAPLAPIVRELAPGAAAADKTAAETVFAARYEAAYERGLYPGLPVTMCEAKLLECRGLSYAACRENCREACGLR